MASHTNQSRRVLFIYRKGGADMQKILSWLIGRKNLERLRAELMETC